MQYMADASTPALRSALILLDDASAILIDRWIEEDLLGQGPAGELPQDSHNKRAFELRPAPIDCTRPFSLPETQWHAIAGSYDKKVRYISDTASKISQSTASVLLQLHRYCELAHRFAKFPPDVQTTSAAVLLELCCRLAEALFPNCAENDPSGDFSWLKSRFSFRPIDLWNPSALETILAAFRAGAGLGCPGFTATIADNLEFRLDALLQNLELVAAVSLLKASSADPMLAAQRYTLDELKKIPAYHSLPPGLDKPVSMEAVRALEVVPARIRSISKPKAAFDLYAEANTELERLEFMMYRLAAAMHAALQGADDMTSSIH